MCQGKFRLVVRKHFFCVSLVLQWHSCPGRGGESLTLEASQSRGDVALRAVVSGHYGLGLDLGI